MPRETPKNHYRRTSDFINTKLYVIATEGYHTEYQYFTALKKQYSEKFDERNLHVEILRRPADLYD